MYRELLKKLPEGYIDETRMLNFFGKAFRKFHIGSQANKESKSFDPVDEAEQECLDIALYSMLLYYRLERLKEILNGDTTG